MKPLHYTTEKKIGDKEKINVEIRLSDDCKNGYCDFAITGTIYRKKSNGTWEDALSGCIHEEILKYFPEFSDFVALHLSNSHGQPMCAVENGIYWLKEDLKKGADYLGISEDLARTLCLSDKEYFKYQLFATGIVSEWREKAKKAIAHLETLCGQSFEDYDKPKVMTISGQEIEKVTLNIGNGYYTEEAIKARERKAEEDKRKDARAKLIARYDNEIRKANFEKVVMLAVFDYFGTTENVIFYEYKYELCFGWQNTYGLNSHYRQYTEKELQEFRRECDVVGMFSLTLTLNDGKTIKAV